jgi:hypothetical protein
MLDHPRPHEPSSTTGMPPRRSLPTTPPTPDLLCEPRRYTSCPAHPSHRPRALALDPTTKEPSASCGRPRHRAGFDRGDSACRTRTPRARALWATATTGPGRQMGRHSRPPAHATPNTVVLDRNPCPVPDFIFSFLFNLVNFPVNVKKV